MTAATNEQQSWLRWCMTDETEVYIRARVFVAGILELAVGVKEFLNSNV